MKTDQSNGGSNAHSGKCASEKSDRIHSTGTFNATSDVATGGTSKRCLETMEPVKTYPKATTPGGGK